MTNRQPKRIIVTTDFSRNAANAYPYALAMARHYQADVTLLHVITVHADLVDAATADETSDSYVDILVQSAERKLEDEEIGDTSSVTVHRAVARGRTAAAGTIAYAADHNADLIVISSHGRRVLGQILLGSVTRSVISEAPCPVLCVKSRESGLLDDANRDLDLSRILIPTDWSDQCRAALVTALTLSEGITPTIHLLHVVHFDPPATIFIPPGRPSVFHLDPDMRERILKHMEEWASGARSSGAEVKTNVLEGTPAKEISKYADQHDVDLIVLGRRCSADEPSFLGSVALRLLHEAHRPMLIV